MGLFRKFSEGLSIILQVVSVDDKCLWVPKGFNNTYTVEDSIASIS